jgi:hypothetical protein
MKLSPMSVEKKREKKPLNSKANISYHIEQQSESFRPSKDFFLTLTYILKKP